jgi:hypothetical protein
MAFGIPKPIARRNLIVVAVGFVQIQRPLFEVKRLSTKKPEGTQPNLTDSIQAPSGSVISKIGYSSNSFSVFRPVAVNIFTRYKPRANEQCTETVPEVTDETK